MIESGKSKMIGAFLEHEIFQKSGFHHYAYLNLGSRIIKAFMSLRWWSTMPLIRKKTTPLTSCHLKKFPFFRYEMTKEWMLTDTKSLDIKTTIDTIPAQFSGSDNAIAVPVFLSVGILRTSPKADISLSLKRLARSLIRTKCPKFFARNFGKTEKCWAWFWQNRIRKMPNFSWKNVNFQIDVFSGVFSLLTPLFCWAKRASNYPISYCRDSHRRSPDKIP